MSACVAFLHFLAAFALFAALAVELMLTRGTLDAVTARRLLVVDGVFGISATVVLLAGIARVLWFAKGPAYYLHDIYFIAKMALFAAIGLLSIYPTLQFLRMRPVLRQGGTPALHPAHQRRVRLVIHVEATLVVLMILCASLMARGVGVIGG
ncbi:MAG TPA: DUF2214 family protein [Casimicrobiaceae bacterium]|jgi:putative membrane protein|nr:DUF2214 family protein [Casimicrobiaceae bacterium]